MRRWWVLGGVLVSTLGAGVGITIHLLGTKGSDAAVVGANVLVAGYTFLAAVAAMQSAASSERTGRRASEALARALRPTFALDVFVDSRVPNAPLVGRIMHDASGPAPVDVDLIWHLSDGREVRQHVDRLEPWRHDLPPGGDISVHTTLAEPAPSPQEQERYVSSVAVEYSDQQGVGRWQQTWIRVEVPVGGPSSLVPRSEPVLLDF